MLEKLKTNILKHDKKKLLSVNVKQCYFLHTYSLYFRYYNFTMLHSPFIWNSVANGAKYRQDTILSYICTKDFHNKKRFQKYKKMLKDKKCDKNQNVKKWIVLMPHLNKIHWQWQADTDINIKLKSYPTQHTLLTCCWLAAFFFFFFFLFFLLPSAT